MERSIVCAQHEGHDVGEEEHEERREVEPDALVNDLPNQEEASAKIVCPRPNFSLKLLVDRTLLA